MASSAAATTSWMDAMPVVALPGQAQRAPAAPSSAPATPRGKVDTSWMDAMPAVSLPAASNTPDPTKPTPGTPSLFQDAAGGLVGGINGLVNLPFDAANTAIDNLSKPSAPNNPHGIGPSVPQTTISPGVAANLKSALAGPQALQGTSQAITASPAGQYLGAQPKTLPGKIAAGAGSMIPFAASQFIPGTGEAEDAGLLAKAAAALKQGVPAASKMAGVGAASGAGQYAGEQLDPSHPQVGGFIGSMVGGLSPIGVEAGLRTAGKALEPLTAAGQQARAGAVLESAASDPAVVRQTLDAAAAADAQAAPHQAVLADPDATPEAKAQAQAALGAFPGRSQIVPGSAPTAFQLTGDQGFGQLERAVGGGSGGNNPGFIARAGAQNQARVDQLVGQAPAGAAAADVADVFRQQLSDLDAQHASEATAGQQSVASQMNALGGNVPTGPSAAKTALQQFGGAMRGSLGDAADTAKTAERGLWSRVDPDGSLLVDMAPIRQAASQIKAQMPQLAKKMSGEEAAIFGTAQMAPKVAPFPDLGALRSRITDEMRNELVANGKSQSYRRMTQLLGAVDGAMSSAVGEKAAADASAVAAGAMAPQDSIQQRIKSYGDTDSQNEAIAAVARSGNLSPAIAGARPDAAAGESGAQRASGAGRGGSGSDSGVAPGTADEVTASAPSASAAAYPGSRSAKAFSAQQDAARQATEAATAPKPNFDAEALERYRGAKAATAQYHQTFTDKTTAPGVAQSLAPGSRSGEYALAESVVPATLFGPGRGAAERVGAYIKAGGDPAHIKDYLAYSLRSAAENDDGTLKSTNFLRWLDQNKEVLNASGLRPQFETVAKAQGALDEATAARAQARKDFEKSAAGKLVNSTDPAATVLRMLRNENSVGLMQDLAKRSAGDPIARAGLQRAAIDGILSDLRGNALAGSERQIKADIFQTFVRKAAPALRQIFTGQQVKAIEDVGSDIQRTQRSVLSTKMPGGSNTAADLMAGKKHSAEGKHSLIGSLGMLEGMGDLGEHFGHMAAGPIGGVAGKIAGFFGARFFEAMRSHGMQKINDLVAEAMLHPELARTLLTKAPGGQFNRSISSRAAVQIRALTAASLGREDSMGSKQ